MEQESAGTGREIPAFTGTSPKSMEDAIHSAAEAAQDWAKANARTGQLRFEVLRQEVVIGNPHISEYRVILTESGGT